jgi:hypothetical protein
VDVLPHPKESQGDAQHIDLPASTNAAVALVIDLEEDKAARAVVCGLLAEMERAKPQS